MSLRLSRRPELAFHSDDDESHSSSSSEQEEDLTWDDWVSDSDNQPCKSLFEDKILPSVAEAQAYDRLHHNIDLNGVCSQLSLDFHQRIRLINWIRKENPSPEQVQSLTGKEPFLSSDEYLIPVVENDPLLQFQTADAWSDSDDGTSAQAAAPKTLDSATRRIRAVEQKLQAAKQELIDYRTLVGQKLNVAALTEAVEDATTHVAIPLRDDDSHYFQSYGENDIHSVMINDKVRTATYASFILTNTELFKDAIVLDVGCGTGILSLFAARAGAKRVIAVDASDIALKAKQIVKDNGLDNVITVLRGKVEDIVLPDDITHVDVIVSEWMGYALLYESMLDSVLRARDRFLKPGGVLAPSQCKMMLALCEAGEILKDRIGFWSDIYGFDMSAMAQDVYSDAIVDIVSAETLASKPYAVKDLNLAEITVKQLDFSSSFTLVSTAERRTKIHALVLYFDTFFTSDGAPTNADVHVVREADPILAEVWQVGGKPHVQRRMSIGPLKGKGRPKVTSFSTGPASVPTHWKQTLFLLREPITVNEGTVVEGTFKCHKSENNSRELDVEIHYSVRDDAVGDGDTFVQIYKVR